MVLDIVGLYVVLWLVAWSQNGDNTYVSQELESSLGHHLTTELKPLMVMFQ